MEEKRGRRTSRRETLLVERGKTSWLVVVRDELVKLASRSLGVGTVMLKDVWFRLTCLDESKFGFSE